MKKMKFRAWDVDEGMLDHSDLMMQRYANAGDNNIFNDTSHIIMQYAGLKDKNGKEIYEGDIVKLYYTTTNTKRDIIKEIVDIYHADRWLNGNRDEFEVIGNIHENPELLEEK